MSTLPATDPIAAAFRHPQGLIESKTVIEGKKVAFISGIIGETQKSGVLYAVPHNHYAYSSDVNINSSFKALRQTVADILGFN